MSKITSKSNVLRKVTAIKKILIETIDGNQNIKRYCRYLTSKTPLEKEGINYKNEIMEQPDLTETLTEKLREGKDLAATSRERILIPYMFDEELLKVEKLLIFVSSPISEFRDSMTEHEFNVTVALNVEYNSIEPFGSERAMEILCELLDEIEGRFVDEKYREDIGYIKFELKKGYRVTERISDKGFIATTIPIKVKVSSMRSDYF